jgi:hypothetical protein
MVSDFLGRPRAGEEILKKALLISNQRQVIEFANRIHTLAQAPYVPTNIFEDLCPSCQDSCRLGNLNVAGAKRLVTNESAEVFPGI